MKLTDIHNIKNHAGVYCIRNTINGKCYIGQSLKLRRRIFKHITNFKTNLYDAPLYRAFGKYGLENFEVIVLDTFRDTSNPKLKETMDKLEKKYIKEYNSYGLTGYNQTYGGDAGVLGLKMTDEQKAVISKNSKRTQNDGRNLIYCYDIETKLTHVAVSLAYLNENLFPKKVCTKRLGDMLVLKRYILARSQQKLDEKKKTFYENYNKYINGGTRQSKLKDVKEFNEFRKNHTIKECLDKYKICKKTYYNWINNYANT